MSDFDDDDLPDHYATLGVARGADFETIRTAWRVLARKWHPDRNPGDAGAEATFKECSAAWNVLSDTERRRAYDTERDEIEFERTAHARTARCTSCGEPAVRGMPLCLRCAIAARLRQKKAKAPHQAPPPASPPPPKPKKKKRTPPKTTPEQQRYEEEVERLTDPDFYDDVIGSRHADHYAAGTGNLDGDSLLEVLMSDASIRSAFEGNKKPAGSVSREGSTIVFSDGQGSKIRLHIDPEALTDLGKNLRTAERVLRSIRRLFS